MRHLTSRIKRLEQHTAAAKDKGFLVVLDGRPPARITSDQIIDSKSLLRGLSKERCIDILEECGHLRRGLGFRWWICTGYRED
jgi:hypothetical protein